MTRRYELIILDWDGTLADSTHSIVHGMQQAISALGWPARDDDQIRSLIGIDFQQALAQLYPDTNAAELMDALLDYRRRHDGGRSIMEAPLYDGVAEALQQLRGGGHRLAVATGKSRYSLSRALEHHQHIGNLFDATRTADETAPKPDPEMVLELLEVLRLPPQRALVVGDTDYDLDMARAAGVDAVAVRGGAHAEQRLRAAAPLAILDGVSVLPEWMGGVGGG